MSIGAGGAPFLRETDFRLEAFRSWCGSFKGKRVALYGTGANARRILAVDGFSASAVIDGNPQGKELDGFRVVSLEEALELGLDAIIVAAEPKSAVPVAKRLYGICRAAGIELFDMFGNDLARLGERVDSIVTLGAADQLEKVEEAETLCVNIELFIDAHFQKPVDECIRNGFGLRECMRFVIESALEQGKRVIIYSTDTNLTADDAVRILERAGLSGLSGLSDLTDVSNSAGTSDLSGLPGLSGLSDGCRSRRGFELLLASEAGLWVENGLYRLIYEPGSSERVVHVGSDLFRDCFVPLVYGMDSILTGDMKDTYSFKLSRSSGAERYEGDWFAAAEMRPASGADERLRACAESVMPSIRGMIGEEPARIVSIVAPLVIGYTTWLVERLEESPVGFREVLFASRDAFIVKHVYDLFRETAGNPALPPSRYFYTSRKASLAAANDHDGSTGERAGTLEYFKACGLGSGASYAFVEFVGAGTCQRQLESFAPFRLKGFYFGSRLVPRSKPTFDSEWWFDDSDVSFLSRYLCLEPFLSSDEPSLTGFDRTGRPIFAEERRSTNELELLRHVHTGILAFARVHASDWYRDGDVVDHRFVDSIMPGLDDCAVADMKLYDDLSGGFMDKGLASTTPRQA